MGNKFLTWVRSLHRYLILIIYITIVCMLVFLILTKHNIDKEPVISPQNTANKEDFLKRIELLERQIEQQKNEIKQQNIVNETYTNNIKQLERRLQAHTELLKRNCEYIMVITVDKKIVPRQCLPEYNWRREEGNG